MGLLRRICECTGRYNTGCAIAFRSDPRNIHVLFAVGRPVGRRCGCRFLYQGLRKVALAQHGGYRLNSDGDRSRLRRLRDAVRVPELYVPALVTPRCWCYGYEVMSETTVEVRPGRATTQQLQFTVKEREVETGLEGQQRAIVSFYEGNDLV